MANDLEHHHKNAHIHTMLQLLLLKCQYVGRVKVVTKKGGGGRGPRLIELKKILGIHISRSQFGDGRVRHGLSWCRRGRRLPQVGRVWGHVKRPSVIVHWLNNGWFSCRHRIRSGDGVTSGRLCKDGNGQSTGASTGAFLLGHLIIARIEILLAFSKAFLQEGWVASASSTASTGGTSHRQILISLQRNSNVKINRVFSRQIIFCQMTTSQILGFPRQITFRQNTTRQIK